MALYKTKETALKHLRSGEGFNTVAFKLFKNDRDVALEATKLDKFYKCIPRQFRNDKEFAEALLCNAKSGGLDYLEMQSIGFELLNDKEFIFVMMGKIPYSLATDLYLACGYDVKYEYDICLRLVEHEPSSIILIPELHKKDEAILIAMATQLCDSKYRVAILKTILEELDLPDMDSDELVQHIKTMKFRDTLDSKLANKEEAKRTVKI